MKLTLNLATRTYLNRRALYAFYAALTVVLVLLLGLNLATYLRSRAHAGQIRTHLAELEQTLGGQVEPVAGFSPSAYDRLLADIAFANEVLDRDSFRWTDLLGRLEGVVPEGVSIRGIQPDHKAQSLGLTGLARDVGTLRQFLDNLIASPDFREVYLLQQAKIQAREGLPSEAVDFSIVVKGAF